MKKLLDELKTGTYTSLPDDVITIMYSGCIANSISLHLTNVNSQEREEFFAIANVRAAWEFLKQFSEIGGRKVFIELEDRSLIAFNESAPYIYRFGED